MKAVFFGLLTFLALGAQAAGTHGAVVTEIYSHVNGWFSFKVNSPVPASVNGCSKADWVFVAGDKASMGYKSFVANLQLAFATKAPVVIYVDGCEGQDNRAYWIALAQQ